jgi:iron complex transport system substrate-binding protein
MKIICLTEESVETLYLIGKEDLISGVSSFVKRPKEAQGLPKVSLFTSSNIDKIIALKPDLVLGFSDIQKDIARELIEKGIDVWIANHRTLDGILMYIQKLGYLVGAHKRTDDLLNQLQAKIIDTQDFATKLNKRPKIYFEEWDDPMISNIGWVSDLIELCGGIDINKEHSRGILAKERFVNSQEIIDKNPDIIFASWCGKKAKIPSILNRDGWHNIQAIKNKNIFELSSDIFLQPGPAPIIDGIDILKEVFLKWQN